MTTRAFKKNRLLLFIFSIGICTLFCGNMLLFGWGLNRAGAYENDQTVLSVLKIERDANDIIDELDDENAFVREIYDYDTDVVPDSPAETYTISNDDFVMLNNFDADTAINDGTPSAVENIFIAFGINGRAINWLQVSGFLNDEALEIPVLEETILDQTTTFNFKQTLDLKELNYIDGTPVSNTEGYYEYIFIYRFIDELGYTSELQTRTFGFWVLDETSYVNTSPTSTIEPKIVNTQKITTAKNTSTYNDGLELNYFNYNNMGTTNYFGEATVSNNLEVPTLIYDAEKYNLSYSKEIYEETIEITTDFIINESDEGIINFYEDGSTTPFKTATVSLTNDRYIYDQLELTDLGNYLINFSYMYKISNDNFVIANMDSMDTEPTNHTRIDTTSLDIFGYQLYYSENNIDDAEFKSDNEITDFSYQAYVEAFNDSTAENINGVWDSGESYIDANGNSAYDFSEIYIDQDENSAYTAPDVFVDDANRTEGIWDDAEVFYDSANRTEDVYDDAEEFVDANSDGIWNNEEDYTDANEDGIYNTAEIFTDENGDGIWNDAETLTTDTNSNGVYDSGDPYVDLNNNGIYDDYSSLNLTQLETSIASTNQAPIFLKSYSSLKYNNSLTSSYAIYRHYSNGVKDDNYTTHAYTNNTRFTENGYYEVVIVYDFQNYNYLNENLLTSGSTIQHLQVFAFKIANVPPEVIIQTTDEEDNIVSGSSTNKDVEISWITGGDFDVNPYAEITMYDFDGNLVLDAESYAQEDLDNGITGDELTLDGDYTVRIYYGPASSTMIVYNFTIDKRDIEGFNIFAITETADGSEYIIDENINYNDELIVSTPFTIDWTDKDSENWSDLKSENFISGKYSFTAISAINNFVAPTSTTTIEQAGEEWVANGYQTSTTFNNLTYDKYETNLANNVFKVAGIYTFYLQDSAGNTYEYTIILDDTTPEIIQNPAAISDNNIVPSETTLIWGTHKAIKISDAGALADTDENGTADLIENSELFDTYNGESYLIIPIEEVEIYSASLTNADELVTKNTDNLIRNYIKGDANWVNEITFYPSGTGDVNGENIYDTYVSDSSTLSETTNLSFNNETRTRLRMNLDRSQGTASTYGTVTGNADNKLRILDFEQGSNRQKLYFSWLDSLDEYEIDSLVYDFYPFTLDNTSNNYPYANRDTENTELDEASLTSMDLLTDATASNNVYSCLPINTIYDSTYGEELTMPGMYVITRTYTGAEELFTGTGDQKVKEYVYYIDRYSIIEQTTNGLIGDEIELLLGETDDRTATIFDSFLINAGDKATLLETNLLPVAFKLPQNKYSYDNGMAYTSGLGSFDLLINIERVYLNSAVETISITGEMNSNGTITLPELYKDGIYTITITDKTGYTDDANNINIGANSFSFSFEIENDKPEGTYYGTPYNEQETSLLNISSTNDSELKFVWEDPIDEYTSSVDSGNITITQTLKDSTYETTIFRRVSGVTTVNTYSLSIEDVEIEDGRYTHYLQIFTAEDNLTNIEAEYTAYIQYEGVEAYYSYDGNNFFSNSISIYVDKTNPEYNLNRLIQADNYLTTDEKNNLLNTSEDINTENYVFSIDNSFSFMQSNIEYPQQDTYLIYYRKYDKYETGDENLQSLVPSDINYSNYDFQPTRPRFNSAITNSSTGLALYSSFSYNQGSFYDEIKNLNGLGTNYYEIIEIDEANNYSIYTVQVGNTIPSISTTKHYANNSDTSDISGTDNEEIDALDFEINSINNLDEWYSINIIDQTNTQNISNTLYHTPYTDEEAFLTQVNALIELPNDYIDSGARYYVLLSDRLGNDIEFIYNAQGARLEPTFTDAENSFEITLPANIASTYIKSFKVYLVGEDGKIFQEANGEVLIDPDNGFYLLDDQYLVPYDRNGATVLEIPLGLEIYEFDAGEYYFELIDNFDRISRIQHIFGVEDVKTITYTNDSQLVEGVTYTSGNVQFTYQSQLYSLNISINEVQIPVNELNITTDILTGIKIVTILSSDYENQSINNFVIELIDSSLTSEIFEYTLYMVTSDIILLDSLGDNLNRIIGGTTTQNVYITWDTNDTLFYNEVSVIRTYEDEDGVEQTVTYTNISQGDSFSLVGRYDVIFSNTLNATSTTTFTIRETETITYSIFTNIVGQTADILAPSATKKEYDDIFIDEYFTIYDYKIDLNPDKNLMFVDLNTGDEITFDDNYWLNMADGTVTYKVVANEGYYYSKTFAVTKVANNSDFISESLKFENYIIATDQDYPYTSTAETLLVTWDSFNEEEGNTVYADYYFNGLYAGRISSTNSITLDEAGIYNLYFYDLAGNQQIFGTSDSYEIVLINEILFSINEGTPIEDIIYNDSVTLQIERADDYDYRTLVVTAVLNGENYVLNKIDDYYLFEDYGYYTVTLSALVDEEEISTNYSFTISNPNQARLSFEYNPRTGYEITNIMKDGVDVTDSFRTSYNSNTLTRLFLSPAEGGNGHYEITVYATYSTLKPSNSFVFDTWINNETPIILSNIDQGATTTDDIVLQFNKYLIYQQLGDCVIKLNDSVEITIDETTSSTNEITNYVLTANNTYLIQIATTTGDTVLSFKLVKTAPLNSVAVFLIIAVLLIAGTLIFIFINLRTRMKVS